MKTLCDKHFDKSKIYFLTSETVDKRNSYVFSRAVSKQKEFYCNAASSCRRAIIIIFTQAALHKVGQKTNSTRFVYTFSRALPCKPASRQLSRMEKKLIHFP